MHCPNRENIVATKICPSEDLNDDCGSLCECQERGQNVYTPMSNTQFLIGCQCSIHDRIQLVDDEFMNYMLKALEPSIFFQHCVEMMKMLWSEVFVYICLRKSINAAFMYNGKLQISFINY